ncbi:TPA: HNH endonuclease signature motif containing protein [Vibrio parahaemolyticus]|uniref:HNH endonuclease n=1 Tax=Vibrio parahaemolyticus TaxID=670 RepID=UPI001A357322|nr:HNH endonuclease signature motif containing protein [Vibrio parahaemolyticus]EGR0400101.1 HNH endonuclease [Vibrio parahaemolyticus]EHR7287187.1 HNH endonuclease [Vibrio parahaemolyticus]EJG1806192.1 HNH endonuclease [Vibrio parahaemolyticus]EJL7825004.1 HNH endonuclease [Vibrio parahaemolyticus]MCI9720687.1 HNH endonuclease [Vibrio parahaemolyticus]
MTFYDWLGTTKLAPSTVEDYFYCIESKISEWANEHKVTDKNLLQVTDWNEWIDIEKGINSIPIYKSWNESAHNKYSSALKWYKSYLYDVKQANSISGAIKEVYESSRDSTVKARLVDARLGQGEFRDALISLWGSCSVSNYGLSNMLVASHIKPWRVATDLERLDPYNGLLLIPNLDKAFDSGLISFDDKGKILISNALCDPEKLGINTELKVSLHSENKEYLSYHRENVFRRT